MDLKIREPLPATVPGRHDYGRLRREATLTALRMEQRNDVGDPKKLTKARNRVSFSLQKGAQPAEPWILTQQDP